MHDCIISRLKVQVSGVDCDKSCAQTLISRSLATDKYPRILQNLRWMGKRNKLDLGKMLSNLELSLSCYISRSYKKCIIAPILVPLIKCSPDLVSWIPCNLFITSVFSSPSCIDKLLHIYLWIFLIFMYESGALFLPLVICAYCALSTNQKGKTWLIQRFQFWFAKFQSPPPPGSHWHARGEGG